MKVRKRTISVDAEQFNGVDSFIGLEKGRVYRPASDLANCSGCMSVAADDHLFVSMPEHNLQVACKGDWIVTSPKGEKTVYRSGAFERLFEFVKEQP